MYFFSGSYNTISPATFDVADLMPIQSTLEKHISMFSSITGSSNQHYFNIVYNCVNDLFH